MPGWAPLSRVALACLPLACAFDTSGVASGTASGESGGSEANESTTANVTTGGEGTGTSGVTDPSDTASEASAGTTSDTDPPSASGCPDALPQDWIFCTDFDDESPEDEFSAWAPAEDRMDVVDGEGRDRSRALEFLHSPDDGWSGRAAVHFGDNPRPSRVYASGEALDEVWVRMYVRTEAEWPSLGPGDLFRVRVEEREDSDDFFTAVSASIYTPEGQQSLLVHPDRCFSEGAPGCDQVMSLGNFSGTTPVYDETRADTWQCIEMHLRLDDGGANGRVEVFVDGVSDALRDDLAFVQGWDARHWNSLQLAGSWDGGAPQSLRRWIDDLVLSRAPIGCD